MKMLVCGLALAFGFPTVAVAQTLPPIAAEDLNRKPVRWPQDFSADRTVLIVAFSRGQQAQVDAWIAALKLKAPGAPAWYEVPLINTPPRFVQGFINNGMRKGIPDPAVRARVVTVYTDRKAFAKTMGLTGSDVHVLVVARDGRLIAKTSGTPGAEPVRTIEAALK